MSFLLDPRRLLRQAAILSALPRGLAGLAWMWCAPGVPVRSVEEVGDASDAPPPLRRPAPDDQPVESGHGPLLHRVFRITVEHPRRDPAALIDLLADDMNRVMVPGVARFDRRPGASRGMRVGDELVVRMPGPWDGPVRVVERVVERDAASFRLATLAGHLEAGQIEFAAETVDDGLAVTITTWARAGDRFADLLYNRLGPAKGIQFQLWAYACTRAAALAQGRNTGGVVARTRVAPWNPGKVVRETV